MFDRDRIPQLTNADLVDRARFERIGSKRRRAGGDLNFDARADAFEAAGKHARLHLRLADRLWRAARPDHRNNYRRLLNRAALEAREYRYARGWNPAALIAFAVLVAINLPGFLQSVFPVVFAGTPLLFVRLYDWSWFSDIAAALAIYAAIMRNRSAA